MGKRCRASATSAADTCFNDRLHKQINALRAKHGSKEVALDLAVADKLQAALDAFKLATPKGTTEELKTALKTAMAAATSTASCGQNFFEYFENSAPFETLVMTTGIATETWYKGKQYYDFATGKIKYPVGDDNAKDKAYMK